MLKQYHEMQLLTTHSSGAEEWHCPECGRRFVAQWEPKFRRVILEPGDEMAIHRGQGELQQQSPEQPSENLVSDDVQLSDVWKELLDRLDFDSDDSEPSKQ